MTHAAPQPATASILTLPEVAVRVGVSLHVLDRLVRQRAVLRSAVLRVGGRRQVLAKDVPLFLAAVRGEPVNVGGDGEDRASE